MPRRVVLEFASEPQEAIVCAALSAHGVEVSALPPSAHLETAIKQAMSEAQSPLLLIDLAALAQLSTSAEDFCAWKKSHCAAADLILYCGGLHAVHPQARAWAQRLGAHDLLPGCDIAHWRDSLLPSVRTILSVAETSADETAIQRALQALPAVLDDTTRVAQAWRELDVVRRFGFDAGDLANALRDKHGVAIRARRYRAKIYGECFVGTDAVGWIAQTAVVSRADAVRIGHALLELGHLYHVVREQPFEDGNFFYRVSANTPRLHALDLCNVTARLRDSGVRIRDRKFHGVTYPACFVGADAVAWLRASYQLSVNEAMTLGQWLIDLFIVHHVVDSQPFRDGKFFYRFYQDED